MSVSRRLEYVLVSVMLLDAIDCLVVESAIDTHADSFKDGARRESRLDGHERRGERGGRIGGTSSRSLVVPRGRLTLIGIHSKRHPRTAGRRSVWAEIAASEGQPGAVTDA